MLLRSCERKQEFMFVTFELITHAVVQLSLLDVAGKVVKTLSDGYAHSGDHLKTFDAAREALPDGFYLLHA